MRIESVFSMEWSLISLRLYKTIIQDYRTGSIAPLDASTKVKFDNKSVFITRVPGSHERQESRLGIFRHQFPPARKYRNSASAGISHPHLLLPINCGQNVTTNDASAANATTKSTSSTSSAAATTATATAAAARHSTSIRSGVSRPISSLRVEEMSFQPNVLYRFQYNPQFPDRHWC